MAARLQPQAGDIGRAQQPQRQGQRIVAAVAGAGQRAREGQRGQRQERALDHEGRRSRRHPHAHAPGQPQQEQRGKRGASGRRLAGPGAPRREQEAHHDRRGKAEHHLVRVPEHPGQHRRRPDRLHPGKHCRPCRDRQRGKDRAAQVERPEPQREQGEAARRRSGRCLARGRRPGRKDRDGFHGGRNGSVSGEAGSARGPRTADS
ncbi:hypothetical protein D3C72_1645340 [compost metagenome]